MSSQDSDTARVSRHRREGNYEINPAELCHTVRITVTRTRVLVLVTVGRMTQTDLKRRTYLLHVTSMVLIKHDEERRVYGSPELQGETDGRKTTIPIGG
ncbi:hypothetical protein J6590_086646 [Homalodisca vitripennis]|nr:hypothetical protein J6590_086646 [Homalodisca vitripennis]